MKFIAQIFIAFIALLILPLTLLAQAKSITSEEYYAASREADSKTNEQIRKRIQIQKLYENGKITETLTGVSEKLPPDKSRWVYTEEKRGKIAKRIEEISIGDSAYRREDNGAWVKRKDGIDIMGPGGIDNSAREFFVEETKIGKEKVQLWIMKTVNYNKTYFDERKTWINEKGLILKSISTTSQNEPKNIISTVEVTYDYKIKPPKIESPIK